MTVMKVSGNWFHWRNDPANIGDSGYVPIDRITGVHYPGSSTTAVTTHIVLHMEDGNSFIITDVTLDEVMTLLKTATDNTSSVQIIAEQANRIRELEAQRGVE